MRPRGNLPLVYIFSRVRALLSNISSFCPRLYWILQLKLSRLAWRIKLSIFTDQPPKCPPHLTPNPSKVAKHAPTPSPAPPSPPHTSPPLPLLKNLSLETSQNAAPTTKMPLRLPPNPLRNQNPTPQPSDQKTFNMQWLIPTAAPRSLRLGERDQLSPRSSKKSHI